MRVFVTGASGMLGSAIGFEMAKLGHSVAAAYHSHPIAIEGCESTRVDITKEVQVRSAILKFGPDIIVNAAAVTDVDRCEREPDLAYKVNVEGARNVLKSSNRVGSRIIHISTGYVFDGTGSNYTEHDRPNPGTVYGKTKLEAERIVQGSDRAFLIVRTAPFGWDHRTRLNLVSWILEELQSGRAITGFTDWFFTPIHANLFGSLLPLMANAEGLYHLAGAERVNRLEFVRLVASEFGFDEKMVIPSTSSVKNLVARPRDTSLDSSMAMGELSVKLPTLREQIREMRRIRPSYFSAVRHL